MALGGAAGHTDPSFALRATEKVYDLLEIITKPIQSQDATAFGTMLSAYLMCIQLWLQDPPEESDQVQSLVNEILSGLQSLCDVSIQPSPRPSGFSHMKSL
jgi:hypothetical protein